MAKGAGNQTEMISTLLYPAYSGFPSEFMPRMGAGMTNNFKEDSKDQIDKI